MSDLGHVKNDERLQSERTRKVKLQIENTPNKSWKIVKRIIGMEFEFPL